MSDEYDSWRRYEDAKAFKNKLAEIDQLKDHIEKLEAALREIEYLDRPQVRGLPRRIEINEIARKALEGKPDRPVYKEGYRAVEEAMGHPSPEFWVERK